MQSLLDLDAGRLPHLIVRLDDRDFALRRPESLPLRDALRIGELLSKMTDPKADPEVFDTAVSETVSLVAPAIAEQVLAPQTIGLARRIVAFYVDHLSQAIERLGAGAASTNGRVPPFFANSRPLSAAPASPPASTLASASNC